MSLPTPDAGLSSPARPNKKRWRALLLLLLLFATILAAAGGYWFSHARWSFSTDNAYVSGNIIQISPQIPGMVVSVLVDDTDRLEPGQPLVRRDPADAQVKEAYLAFARPILVAPMSGSVAKRSVQVGGHAGRGVDTDHSARSKLGRRQCG